MPSCGTVAWLLLLLICLCMQRGSGQQAGQAEAGTRKPFFERLRRLEEQDYGVFSSHGFNLFVMQFRRFQELTLTRLQGIADNYNISYNIEERFLLLTDQYTNISQAITGFQDTAASDLNSLKFWTKKLQKKSKKLDLKMVPRLHLGVLELWLEFRRFQRENQQMRKRIKGLMAQDATCCQDGAQASPRSAGAVAGVQALPEGESTDAEENQGADGSRCDVLPRYSCWASSGVRGLVLEISNFKNEVLQKTQTLEGEVVVLQGKVGDLEETEETDRTVENTESNETTDMPALPAVTPTSQPEMVYTSVDQSGDTHVTSVQSEGGINNASDPLEVGVGLSEPEMKSCHSEVSANRNSLDKLRLRVSDLTQLLNGHTDLLAELYERLSALEGHELDQRPSEYEGSGDHQ
ncbi:Pentraxin-4 [Acipenser ruthenus]|uniref:Pentraxin-4 n=1 Tax=Acipenser ruthenus TaxID=7906 RepID=A0A444UBC0_ACIRT|nr:Pentraxin-4 [Acipenser ruthenus]